MNGSGAGAALTQERGEEEAAMSDFNAGFGTAAVRVPSP